METAAPLCRMLSESIPIEQVVIISQPGLQSGGQIFKPFRFKHIHTLEGLGQEQVHIAAVIIQRVKLEPAKAVDELTVSHLSPVQAAPGRFQEKFPIRFIFQEAGSWPHIQAVPHLLTGQGDPAVDPLEYIQPRPLRRFGIDDVQSQVAVLNAILELGGKFIKLLAVNLRLRGQTQAQAIHNEIFKGGQPLQTVDHHHLAVFVFGNIENGQRYPHRYRLDELALLVNRPDETPLKVRVHYEPALPNAVQDVADGPGLRANQHRIQGIGAQFAILRGADALDFILRFHRGRSGLLLYHCSPCYSLPG